MILLHPVQGPWASSYLYFIPYLSLRDQRHASVVPVELQTLARLLQCGEEYSRP